MLSDLQIEPEVVERQGAVKRFQGWAQNVPLCLLPCLFSSLPHPLLAPFLSLPQAG